MRCGKPSFYFFLFPGKCFPNCEQMFFLFRADVSPIVSKNKNLSAGTRKLIGMFREKYDDFSPDCFVY